MIRRRAEASRSGVPGSNQAVLAVRLGADERLALMPTVGVSRSQVRRRMLKGRGERFARCRGTFTDRYEAL